MTTQYEPTEEDVNIIAHQLKRRQITKPVKILRRCRWGYPMVSLAGCAHRKSYHDPNTTVEQQQKSSKFHKEAREQKIQRQKQEEEEIKDERPIKKQKLDQSGNYKGIKGDEEAPESNKPKKKRQSFIPVPGTMVWLTCPKVRLAIDKVEENGALNVLRQIYDKEPKELYDSHDAYANFLRKEMNDDQLFVQWKSANQVLDKSKIEEIPYQRYGNAGQRIQHSLKCLHAHVADFLGGCYEDKTAQRGWELANHLNEEGKVEDIEDLCEQKLPPITEAYLSTLDCSEGCAKCDAYSKSSLYSKITSYY
eukprot:CAMPEP_0117423744 /NCGR_PEP_ID=MMETSP0758-20121206/4298_1 /TAXON_ID=63605 /ORGANISM="Percolomonas cosmopolitus, Strain AE-1 (ATCC 50343)" /LENGTH=306 /DNA_ID=CAMNT_0005207099 /DNA_START=89 /DNA_END=1009 /DNA_ORIENTATION=+